MRVIIADDEPMALEVFERMLKQYPDVEIAGQYTDVYAVLEAFDSARPDVAFLDIEMGSESGIELGLELLQRQSSLNVVFVTAHSQYAIDAFEVNAIDYLLKPVRPRRLADTISRLHKKERTTAAPEGKDQTVKLRIRSFGGFEVFSATGDPLSWRTQKTKELFAYLWYHRGRPCEKTEVVEALFSDKPYDQAMMLLHTTVYQLRRSVSAAGFPDGVLYINGNYSLAAPCTSDAEELEVLLGQEVLTESEIEKVLELYRGDFMKEGYPWLVYAQYLHNTGVVRVLRSYVEQRLKLQGSHSSTDVAKADASFGRFDLQSQEHRPGASLVDRVLRKLHEADPFSDDIAALILKVLAQDNRKRDMDFFYQYYTDHLKAEIAADPSRELVRLYEELRSL